MNVTATDPRRTTLCLSTARIALALATCLGLTSVTADAQDASVIAVRPQGAVIDAAQLDDLKRGSKVGFVRDGDEREEIAQGWVLDIKDGKALVGLKPGSGVKKGDLVVLCPPAGEDPHADVRAKLEEMGDVAPAPKGRKPSAAQRAAQQAGEALEARDAAVAEGKCDVAALDEQLEALAGELSRAASRVSPPREASRPRVKTPARAKPVEQDEETSEEEGAGEDSAVAAPPEAQNGESSASEEPPTTAARDKAAPTLQTAIDAVLKLIESGAQKSGRRDRKRAEPASPVEESPVEEEEESAPVTRRVIPPSPPPADAPSPAPVSAPPPKEATPPSSTAASGSSPAPAPGAVTDPVRPERRSDRWSRRGGRGQDRTATDPVKEGAAPTPPTSSTAASAPMSPAVPGPMIDPVRPGRRGDGVDRVRGGRVQDRTATEPSKEAPASPTATPRDASDRKQPDKNAKAPAETKQPEKTTKPAPQTKETPPPWSGDARDATDRKQPEKIARVPADTKQPDKIAKLPAETKPPEKTAKTPAPASEPARTATITGRVVGDKGQPLSGARVAISGGAPGATTSGQGAFEIKNLRPGAYKLVVSMPGFTEETRAVTVGAGKSETVTVSLKTSANRPGATPGAGTKPKKFGGDADD